MKKVKLYGVESVVDNEKFKNYTLLSEMLAAHVSDLYEHQRSYNTYIYTAAARLAVVFGNERISSLVKESLCAGENMALYLTASPVINVFPKNSYSQA